MNRIVRDHYPVSKLPEDLREGFGPNDEVRVTIDAPAGLVPTLEVPPEGHFSRFAHLRRENFKSMEEIVAHVRALRDEWNDRD